MNIELKERSRDYLLEIISAKDMKITMQKIEIEEMREEIERLNYIIAKAKEKSIYLQKRYGYILDDLTYLLMQGSDKE